MNAKVTITNRMKQRTTAFIDSITVDDQPLDLSAHTEIEIEFSAIDTGGGFHDPILDFSYLLEGITIEEREGQVYDLSLEVRDPSDEENQVAINYRGTLTRQAEGSYEAMGRLKDDNVSRSMVKFVMRSVR